MPSISNSRSCGPISVSNSSEYDIPEQPPPFTPIRRNTFSGRFWELLSSLTCWTAFSDSASAMIRLLLLGRRRGGVLFPIVGQRGLDRVLGQDRAVDLDGRQLQLVDDVGVLDLAGLVHGLALEPLGGQARGGDGAAAAERLELRVL